MNANVDNRVVEMRFDNAQFEKGVKQSMDSLDKLEESLKLEDAGKGIEEVANRFTAFETIATGVLIRLGQKVTDFGTKFLKSMTIDQIAGGFSKYEQELRSTQIIMNATGESIENVTGELAKLMWYTDETSYSYGNMVDNISKFTSQGIKLAEANQAMQGIANMAGLVGASVTDASHAMDGFAKAMAAGSMKLQNWKWIQTAHMETVQTKEAFIEAAVACGELERGADGLARTIGKKTVVSIENFTETLHEGWLSSQAMMTAFTDMATYSDVIYQFINNLEGSEQAMKDLGQESFICSDAMEILEDSTKHTDAVLDAYKKSWQSVTGEILTTEQATEKLANITKDVSYKAFQAGQQYRTFQDAIDATADAVTSAWKKIFGSIFGNAEEATALWTEVGNTFYTAFAEPLSNLGDELSEWHDLGGFKDALEAVKKVITALGRVFGPFKEAFSKLFPPITAERFDRFVQILNAVIDKLMLTEDASIGLSNILNLLAEGPLGKIVQIFRILGKVVILALIKFSELRNLFLSLFKDTTSFTAILSKLGSVLAPLGHLAGSFFLTLGNSITNLIKNAPQFGSDLISGFSRGISSAFGIFNKYLSKFKDFGKNAIQGFQEGLQSGWSFLLTTIKNIAKNIISSFQKLLGIHSPMEKAIYWGKMIIAGLIKGMELAVNLLTYSIKEICRLITKLFDREMVGAQVELISKAFDWLGTILNVVVTKLQDLTKNINIGKLVLEGFAIAFGVAVVKILLSVNKLIGGLGDIAGGLGKFFDNLGDTPKAFNNYLKALGKAEQMNATANALKSFALALAAVTVSLIALTKVDSAALMQSAKAVAIISGALVGLIGIFKLLDALSKRVSGASAGATDPLGKVTESLGKIAKSFTSGILAPLSQPAKIAAIGLTVSMIGLTILEIAGAVKLMSTIPIDQLTQSIVVLGLIGAFMLKFLKVIQAEGLIKMGPIIKAFGVTMIELGVAIGLLVIPIKALSFLSLEEIFNGSVLITACGLWITNMAKMMATGSGMTKACTKFGLTMIELAFAIDMLIIPIKTLAGMNIMDIAKGAAFIGGCMFFITKVEEFTHGIGEVKGIAIKNFGLAMLELAAAIDLMLLPFITLRQYGFADFTPGVAFIMGYMTFIMALNKFLDLNADLAVKLQPFGLAMIELAAAMDLMLLPFVVLRGMDPNDFNQALTATILLGGVVAGLIIVLDKFQGIGNLSTKAAASVAILSGCLVLISGALKILEGMPLTDVAGKAVILMGVMLVLGMVSSMAEGFNPLAAAGVAILAASMGILAGVFKLLETINFDAVWKNAALLTGIMAVLGIVTAVLGGIGPATLAGAGALVLVAGGLVVLVEALRLFSTQVNPDGIRAVFAAIHEAVTPTLLAELAGLTLVIDFLGGSISIFTAIIAAAASVLVISLGLAVAAATPALMAIEGIVNGLAQLGNIAPDIGERIDQLIQKLPALGVAAGAAVVGFASQISQNGQTIVDAVMVIVSAVIAGIASKAIVIAETIMTILEKINESLARMAPVITQTVLTIFAQIIGAAKVLIPDIISLLTVLRQAVVDQVVGLANDLANLIPSALDAAFHGFTDGLVKLIEDIGPMIVRLLTTIEQSITTYLPQIIQCGRNIKGALLEGITGSKALGDWARSGQSIVGGIISGITGKLGDAKNSGNDAGAAVVDGVNQKIKSGEMEQSGGYAVEGLVNGVNANLDKANDSGNSLGAKFLAGFRKVLGIASPSKEAEKDMKTNFWDGLKNGVNGIVGDVKNLGAKIGSVFSGGFSGALDQIEASVGASITGAITRAETAAQKTLREFTNKQYHYSAELSTDKDREWSEKQRQKLAEENAKMTDISLGGGGGSSSTKATEKSIKELADTYHYGESAIKSFTNMYGKSIQKMDETADVSKIATQAVDQLAVKLYTLSDDYQKDLNDASLNTEKVLQHIQASFNEVYDGITNSLKSVDLFSAFEESEDWEISDKIDDAKNHLESMEDYVGNAQIFAKMENIPDQLKQSFLAAGYQSKEALKMFVTADEEEVDELVSIWQEATNLATSAGGDIMGAWAGQLINIENTVQGQVLDTGAMFAAGFANAIPPDAANTQATQMALNAVQAMRDALGIASPSKVTNDIGEFFVQGFTSALDVWMTPIYEKGKSFSSRAAEGLKMGLLMAQPDLVQNFFNVGVQVIEGLAQGIEANRSRAITAAVQVARDAYEAACEELDIESPSKKFRWIGKMVDEGFAQGIESNSNGTVDAAHQMAEDVYNIVSEDLNREYSIKPILDLSNIRANAGSIGSMLEGQRVAAFGIQNGNTLPQNGASYNFVQNNYSPKALSRIDIYRQTKNQFSMLKGV